MIKEPKVCKRIKNLRKRMDLAFSKYSKSRASKMNKYLQRKFKIIQIINLLKKHQIIIKIKINKYSITI